jgi:signal transduction histidine kinase
LPQLGAVTVISREGKLLNFSRDWPIPDIDVTDRDYYQALRDDPTLTSFVSAPARNRGNGEWTIFVGRRVSAADGTFLGIILGAIEMHYFEEFYSAISHGEDSSIALQRSDGVMLTRFPVTDAVGKTFSGFQRLLNDGVSGTIRELSPIDGKMRLKAAHRLANFPMLVLVTKTEEAALANWRSISRLMLLGALACALSIALAGFAVGRHWKQQAVLAEAQAELRRQEERTQAFEAMRDAKEAAETADRAKSEFLATMSHELRTPLNAVLGFSEVMLSDAFGPIGNERYRGYVKDIYASGKHLLNIVNDVLDLSKAASGKLELAEDWIDAAEPLRSACRLLAPRIAEAGLRLSVDTPPAGLMICADERLLKQMLLNLLSNACKFTPRGGDIECRLAVETEAIRFSIKDTGTGIPPEHLDRVLHPFVQVDSSLSRRHEGTGLGLTLVKAMAELHGGSLRLDSAPGRGTTATVRLPLSRLQPPEGCDLAAAQPFAVAAEVATAASPG